MQEFKTLMEDKYKFLHQRFIQHFFLNPYTKIEFVVDDLTVSRPTAANYYINVILVELLIGELVTDGYMKRLAFQSDFLSNRCDIY